MSWSVEFLEKPQDILLANDSVDDAFRRYATLQLSGSIIQDGVPQHHIYRRHSGAPWGAYRVEKNTFSANYQGNPLWPARVVAKFPYLATHLELSHSYTKNMCIVPTPSRFNERLARLGLNKYGFKEITSYPSYKNCGISDFDYVSQFVDGGFLPYAAYGERDAIHDWSYHSVSFLFEGYLDQVRTRFRRIVDALSNYRGADVTYAWDLYGCSFDEKTGLPIKERVTKTMPHVHALYRQLAVSLDVASAKPSQVLHYHYANKPRLCQLELDVMRSFADSCEDCFIRTVLWMEKKSLGSSCKGSLRDGFGIRVSDLNAILAELNTRAANPGDGAPELRRVFIKALGSDLLSG